VLVLIYNTLRIAPFAKDERKKGVGSLLAGREYVHNFYSAGLEQCTPVPKEIWSSVFLGIRVKVPNLLRPGSKYTFSALVSLAFLLVLIVRYIGVQSPHP